MGLCSQELDSYGLINRFCISELLIVHSQSASESHFQIFVPWTPFAKNVVIHCRLLKAGIVELAAGERRSIQVGSSKSTACEIARVERTAPKIAGIKN